MHDCSATHTDVTAMASTSMKRVVGRWLSWSRQSHVARPAMAVEYAVATENPNVIASNRFVPFARCDAGVRAAPQFRLKVQARVGNTSVATMAQSISGTRALHVEGNARQKVDSQHTPTTVATT
jgi:hypothetical protein